MLHKPVYNIIGFFFPDVSILCGSFSYVDNKVLFGSTVVVDFCMQ